VIAGTSDAEGFGQSSRATGEPNQVARVLESDISGASHLLDAQQGFEGAEENRARFPFALTGDVQAVVIAVDEINVGKAGRSEQDRGAGGIAGSGVGRGIVLPQVGFDFNDTCGQAELAVIAHKYLTQEFAGDGAWIAGEESAIERADGSGWERRRQGGRRLKHHKKYDHRG
jgi:hypothetical protein